MREGAHHSTSFSQSGGLGIGERLVANVPRHVPRQKPLILSGLGEHGERGERFSGSSLTCARARACVRVGKTFPTFPTFPEALDFIGDFAGNVGCQRSPTVPTFPGRFTAGERCACLSAPIFSSMRELPALCACARCPQLRCRTERARARTRGRACARAPCRAGCAAIDRCPSRAAAAARSRAPARRGRRSRPRPCRTGPTTPTTKLRHTAPSLSDASIISSMLPRKPSMPATSSTPPMTCAQVS